MYLNSFFSPWFSIAPLVLRRLRSIPTKPVIIAPRGEFSRGALGMRPLKKRVWLFVARRGGLCNDALWQATSDAEARNIHRAMGNHARVRFAPELTGVLAPGMRIGSETAEKAPGYARIVFLSRISPMKNLEMAVNAVN